RYGCIASAVLVLAVIGMAAYVLIQRVQDDVLDAYAQSWAASMVIEFMERNGEWPRSWEELEESFEVIAGKSGAGVFDFDGLRGRIAIDFTANPDLLAKAIPDSGNPPFHVISLRNGRTTHWSG